MRINSPPANSEFIMKMLVGSHKATSLVHVQYWYDTSTNRVPGRIVLLLERSTCTIASAGVPVLGCAPGAGTVLQYVLQVLD